MSSRGYALRKYRKSEKQVYHKGGKVYRGKSRGSGHQAGESWGEAKQIDPEIRTRIYSKKGRSPSFDQGVRNYKTKAYNKALAEAKVTQHFNKEKIKKALR